MTGLPWEFILWELPAAIACQLQLLYWQREGVALVKDESREILEKLNG